MMKEQTSEFLLGYLFGELERKIVKDIAGKSTILNACPQGKFVAQIPLLWFGVRNPNYVHPDKRADVVSLMEELCCEVDKKLKDIFPKRIFATVPRIEKQHVFFMTTMVEDRRKMTLSQIEDALGYKITLVSEVTK